MSNLPHLKTPSIFVILGATGDLANKKIFPSLWRLFKDDLLPNRCFILAFAKTAFSREEFRNYIKENLKEKVEDYSEESINSFLELFTYLSGNFESEKSFQDISKHLANSENSWGICSNKVFFLAAPPSFYQTIFVNLAKVKLNIPCGGELGWTRILIEKPFGNDLKTSQKLQKLLSRYFKEEQIYRIDHYLAKEIVQGISSFRFSNNLFENSWNNKLIEKIEIRLFESVGAEQRGSFYDALGALRDVGQNHLLELLALITMKFPPNIDPLIMRANRAEVLKSLKKWDKKSIIENSYRAQYQGYLEIEGVKPNSKTETFFSLKTELENPAFEGVKIIIESGKQCKEAKKEIVVTLKRPPLCFLCQGERYGKNQVIFQIEPKSQILIRFWTKKPGFETKLEERFFSFFLYERKDKTQYVQEYAKLFYEAMVGDQTSFVSKEEIESLWSFTDPIVRGWKNELVPLKIYKPGATAKVIFDKEIEETLRVPFTKKIGMIGLGKMGSNLSRRLIENGWQVYGYNKTSEATKSLEKEGLCAVYSLKEIAEKLQQGGISEPRIIWLMVPAAAKTTAGKLAVKPVDEVLFGREGLIGYLKKGDIIIDGGNSFYKDSINRFKKLKKAGINFVDVGVSGGPNGAREGASLMIGGEKNTFKNLEFLFSDLAQPNGYQFFEGAGAGHFVKMAHNGIEYGMMQAIAEGFTILKKAKYKLNLKNIADVYNHGSVIESRLIGWLKNGFNLYGDNLEEVSGSVGYTGEGAWTVKTAKEMKIKTKIITEALKFRVNSKKDPSYAGQILSALRNQFGGHSL